MSVALSAFINGFADAKKAQKAAKEREEERALRREEAERADARASAPQGRSLPGMTAGEGRTLPGGGASVPTGDVAARARARMLHHGLPEHIADAFLLNFKDESGLNPGIEERTPNVHGTRGFGLYQLTGPRRDAYEAYVRERGVSPSDIDAQIDFMVSELHGSEKGAWKAISAAPDTGTAAAAIVSKFLRPAKVHERRRIASYLGQPLPAEQPAPRRAATTTPAAPAATTPVQPIAAPVQVATAQPAARSFSITPGAAAPWTTFARNTGYRTS